MAYKRSYRKAFRRPSYKRKYRGKSYRKTSLKKTINSVLMKKIETKSLVASGENIQLYHNGGATAGGFSGIVFNPWQAIAQGAGNNSRIGTEIYPRGMAVRMELFNKLDRPNITYRILVLVIPKIYNGVATSVSFDWRDTVGSGNTLLSWIKPDTGIKVLYDKTIRNEVGFSAIASAVAGDQDNKEAHKMLKFYIRSKPGSKLMWDPMGNLINKPIALYVIPYDSYGTLITDNIASCALNTKYYWKDI